MIAYLNGQFLDDRDAFLNIKDLSIQRGYGVFDFLCFRQWKPLFLNDYLERFFGSAEKMFMEIPISKEELVSVILQLIKRNNLPDGGIRLQLTGGLSPDGYSIAASNFFVTQQVITPISEQQFVQGTSVISFEYQRELPEIKSTNYLVGVWLNASMKHRNAKDVFFHRQGIVSEFPRANIFMVNEAGQICTPAKNILRGITRKKVIELAKKDYEVLETSVTVDELLNAREVFLTSTTRNVFPVTKINNAKIGAGVAGPVTAHLNAQLLILQQEFVNA